MGLILPFYSLIDMLETAVNVWSDTCVTKVVNDDTVAQEDKAAALGRFNNYGEPNTQETSI